MPQTPQITLTATLDTLTGGAAGSTANPAKLVVTLCNYDPHLPRIAGTAMVAAVVTIARADDASQVSIPLWGNDVITPAGTYYNISIVDGQGNIVQSDNYQLTGSGTIDLSALTPYVPSPFPPNAVTFADDIVPTGVINGFNDTFTLPQSPNPPSSLNLFLNGQRLTEGLGYVLKANTITYQPGFIPQVGDTHLANYRYFSEAEEEVINFADDIVPDGTIDGSNDVFTLPQAPNPPASLDLYLNGLHLTPGIAYTLEGDTITYETAYIPAVGDTHISSYRY